MDDAETVLLIDSGKDQHSIDVHHVSPIMKKILELRNKYELHMKAEHCLSDEAGIADADSAFIKKGLMQESTGHGITTARTFYYSKIILCSSQILRISSGHRLA